MKYLEGDVNMSGGIFVSGTGLPRHRDGVVCMVHPYVLNKLFNISICHIASYSGG